MQRIAELEKQKQEAQEMQAHHAATIAALLIAETELQAKYADSIEALLQQRLEHETLRTTHTVTMDMLNRLGD